MALLQEAVAPSSTITTNQLKAPHSLSLRMTRLRDWYHEGTKRSWRNENSAWTTGTPWDVVFEEMTYHIVPEMFVFLEPYRAGYYMAATTIELCPKFWKMSLPKRRAWFVKEVMVRHIDQTLLPGSLLAGSRFNIMASRCFNRREWKEHDKGIYGKNGARSGAQWFFRHGYGNVGSTSGHIIPDYKVVLHIGWKGIYDQLAKEFGELSVRDQRGPRGEQIQAMMIAATMPRELAARCQTICEQDACIESDELRRRELMTMGENLKRVPWEPPQTFWEALQTLWITHMLTISDENYIGGTSFGRIDQYLLPFWERSLKAGMSRDFGKEILRCLWIHTNTAYDAVIRMGGRQGMVAGYGQLMTLSGLLRKGVDGTNDLTYAFLEVADEMDPLLQPKINVRLHRNSPDTLLDTLVDMIARYQGSPTLLNFDERAMAGMMREGRRGGCSDIITAESVYDYSPLGCLENTMVGNDRSGTADIHLNLWKPVELALNNGFDMVPAVNVVTNALDPCRRYGPPTGAARTLRTWESFQHAVAHQVRYCIANAVDIYERTDVLRSRFCPTPYLSCLVDGCASKGIDVSANGATINFTTIEGTALATAVDSLLAIKYLVYDTQTCSLDELRNAVATDWHTYDTLRAMARFKAPKYGCNTKPADELTQWFMTLWTDEVWRHQVPSTGRRFRPGMLSWNTMIGDAMVAPASADGRRRGNFFSNALCPTNGVDREGPLAVINSAGLALGGKSKRMEGDWEGYINMLPNGASHTMSFNPSMLGTPDQRERFKGLLRGYAENGGTALQINMIDEQTLRQAQKDPQSYAHLMVRITGYNAYFINIGQELQNEVIARMVHQ